MLHMFFPLSVQNVDGYGSGFIFSWGELNPGTTYHYQMRGETFDDYIGETYYWLWSNYTISVLSSCDHCPNSSEDGYCLEWMTKDRKEIFRDFIGEKVHETMYEQHMSVCLDDETKTVSYSRLEETRWWYTEENIRRESQRMVEKIFERSISEMFPGKVPPSIGDNWYEEVSYQERTDDSPEEWEEFQKNKTYECIDLIYDFEVTAGVFDVVIILEEENRWIYSHHIDAESGILVKLISESTNSQDIVEIELMSIDTAQDNYFIYMLVLIPIAVAVSVIYYVKKVKPSDKGGYEVLEDREEDIEAQPKRGDLRSEK